MVKHNISRQKANALDAAINGQRTNNAKCTFDVVQMTIQSVCNNLYGVHTLVYLQTSTDGLYQNNKPFFE